MKKKPYNIITGIQNMVLGEFTGVRRLPLAPPRVCRATSKLKNCIFSFKLVHKLPKLRSNPTVLLLLLLVSPPLVLGEFNRVNPLPLGTHSTYQGQVKFYH
jgi:hypothetical protein